jgi:hypothetical protein
VSFFSSIVRLTCDYSSDDGWGLTGPLALGSALKTFERADSVKGRTAAQFTIANSESLSRASGAGLSTGDVDFWWAGWVYADSFPGTNMDVAGKWGGSTNEWDLVFPLAAPGVPTIFVAGSSKAWSGAISATAWHFIMVYHDHTNDLIGISVDGAAFLTAALVGGPTAGNSSFVMGSRSSGSNFFGGRQGNGAFGKSPTDSFATINALLYNAGAGLRYSALTAAQVTSTGLIGWWELDEESGTRADKSANALTLTDNNTVTSNDGKVAYAVTADASVVAIATDQGAAALVIQQTTHTKKPLLKTNIINTQPVLRLDGVDDFLKVATGAISNQPCWGWVVVDDNDAATRYYLDGGAASKVSVFHDGTNLNANAGSSVGAAHTAGAPHLVTFSVNGVSSQVWVDGTSLATGDAGAQNQDSGIVLGADNAGASPLAGDIAEVAIVAGTPSAADLANLKAYINTRYALSVV